MSIPKGRPYGTIVPPSKRKLKTLHLLSVGSIKLSDGYDYRLYEDVLSNVNLEKVRKALSAIKGSLSQEVIKEREEE